MKRSEVRKNRLYKHEISGLIETGDYFITLRKGDENFSIVELKRPTVDDLVELLQNRGVI